MRPPCSPLSILHQRGRLLRGILTDRRHTALRAGLCGDWPRPAQADGTGLSCWVREEEVEEEEEEEEGEEEGILNSAGVRSQSELSLESRRD